MTSSLFLNFIGKKSCTNWPEMPFSLLLKQSPSWQVLGHFWCFFILAWLLTSWCLKGILVTVPRTWICRNNKDSIKGSSLNPRSSHTNPTISRSSSVRSLFSPSTSWNFILPSHRIDESILNMPSTISWATFNTFSANRSLSNIWESSWPSNV